MRNRHLKTILTTLCVLAPLAFATGAHADPTGTLAFSGQLASGATPTAGSAQSFTVSGVLSDPEYLWVYVDPTGQGCADDPADEAVLPVTAIAAGVPLNSGYYSLNYSYVPELQSSSYAVCGYADDASTDTDPVASNELDFQTAGPSATVNISSPILSGGATAPMPQLPASLTVSGSTTTPAYLWVYADPNANPCADDPAEEAAYNGVATIGSAVPLSTGNFTFTYSYVPTLPGNSYSLCAYVDDNANDATPYGEVEQDFTTGQPQGALTLSAASAPIAGLQDSFQLTGTTPVTAYLWTFVDPSGSGCADSPLDEMTTPGVTALTNQLSLVPGPISYSYSYTPTVGGQEYTLCSYIDDTAGDATPYAAVEYDFTAAVATGTLTARAVGEPYKDRSFTVNLAGSAQVSERLWVYLDTTGDGCSDDPQDEQTQTSRSPLIAGQQMPAGAFSASVTLTPGSSTTSYDLCAYLDDTASDSTPVAQLDYQFTPRVAPKPAPHLNKLTANSKLTRTRVTVTLTAVANATARVIVTSGRKRHILSVKFGSSGQATLKLPASWASGKRGRVLHVTVTARDSYGKSKTLRLTERLPN